MDIKISKELIKQQADNLKQLIRRLDDEKILSLERGKISIENFQEINGQQQLLETNLSALYLKLIQTAFEEISLSDTSPGANLAGATANLANDILHLDQKRQFLLSVAQVIDGVTAITAQIAKLAALA
jgi:flagellar biosynthesis/type III secretory pathway chaperone